ncbi:flagellar basal body P-ring protein FlgI [Hyphomicrobium sp.]|jgi:flagellar P-ring protein precursor FlgI|uniref:flagellar basal body P-ring protein FlgI n=1 Tax=Hyphomicrobium sp. TaxID=82 RepID=UPI002C2315F6|nr:flagellar basal body P-ring protein FlgI [Hyphomicrobium sp.]HVZ04382.1 flagellar basal body P-ring protein FlgI [Hyphomicrobium sp.]
MRICIVLLVLLLGIDSASALTRIKDITDVKGVRANQLVGYGLVVGLNNTGDTLRNAPFTQQSLQAMLDRMGVNIRGSQYIPNTRNVAAVMVTAELPPFATKGTRFDVTVASMGDAKSLAGGSLIMTSLAGADQVIYAAAQGPITISGYLAKGAAESITAGIPTRGRIPNGAIVEKNAPASAMDGMPLELELRNPDFTTAVRIMDAINSYSSRRFGMKLAEARDFNSVALRRPRGISTSRLFAEVGELMVDPDQTARVVIDERTGTIVIGADVHISTVAVAHGNITVRVKEKPKVSQPLPFSKGKTVTVPDTDVDVYEAGGNVSTVRGASLRELVSALNHMGLKPIGIIAILQAMKTAGALQAELVVQ